MLKYGAHRHSQRKTKTVVSEAEALALFSKYQKQGLYVDVWHEITRVEIETVRVTKPQRSRA